LAQALKLMQSLRQSTRPLGHWISAKICQQVNYKADYKAAPAVLSTPQIFPSLTVARRWVTQNIAAKVTLLLQAKVPALLNAMSLSPKI
jgi:hypothetical protein